MKPEESDLEYLILPLLQLMADAHVDYHLFFRQLGAFKTTEIEFQEQIAYDQKTHHFDSEKAVCLGMLLSSRSQASYTSAYDYLTEAPENTNSFKLATADDIAKSWVEWATFYRQRLLRDTGLSTESPDQIKSSDLARQERMNLVNPKFILRSWILDEIATSVQDALRKKDFIGAKGKLDQAQRLLIGNVWGASAEFKAPEDKVASAIWSAASHRDKINLLQFNYP